MVNINDEISKKSPLLSFVLVGRNDNYGGDFKSRLQRCILSLFDQLNSNKIASEIIFVNYNPLPDNAISNFILWPKSNEFITIKIITVANHIHQNFINNHQVKDVPVLEYPAKNAGIRRANGDFIVAMNPDIIFDNSFFKDIKNLKKTHYYRSNRFDFRLEKAAEEPKNILEYAKNNVCKVWVKAISKSVKVGRVTKSKFCLILVQQKAEIIKYNLLQSFNFLWRKKLHSKAENRYHCNVSGDFMLMHKSAWQKIKAYKEDAFLALHIDALLVVQAATLSLKEFVYPYPIYHQEHDRRYNAETENLDFRKAYLTFQEDSQIMIKEKKPTIFNSEHWGFAHLNLEETLL